MEEMIMALHWDGLYPFLCRVIGLIGLIGVKTGTGEPRSGKPLTFLLIGVKTGTGEPRSGKPLTFLLIGVKTGTGKPRSGTPLAFSLIGVKIGTGVDEVAPQYHPAGLTGLYHVPSKILSEYPVHTLQNSG